MREPIPEPAVQSWDFPRSVAGINLLARFADDHGIARADLFHGVTVAEAALNEPDAQVAAQSELTVIRNLVRALDDPPGLGLQVGRRYRVATFGIFGFACISSPTLRDAVVFALRYLDLSFTFCIPHVAIDQETLRLTLDDLLVPPDVRPFLVERDLTAILTVVGDLLAGPAPIERIDLRLPAPRDIRPHVELFGVRPRFDHGANVATLDVAHLDRPLPQANDHTVALCEAQCRQLVEQRRTRVGIAHEVRKRLIRVGGAPAGIEEIATALAMSERTLRRKLTEADTSYRALLDEVRHALADQLLRTGALSVEDVAIRLGYAESASFIHAYTRWTGTTPASRLRTEARPS